MIATSLYGSSVAPVKATALSHSTVRVSWFSPNPSNFQAIRLVRNQYAFSENQEDGEILYEYNGQGDSGEADVTEFFDGVDTSLSTVDLIPGQHAYYSIWLLLSNAWVNAGQASALVPSEHGSSTSSSVELKTTHTKVMELLPRVYTSATYSPFDEIDETSDLYKFMKGISLTFDEMLTLADLTAPSASSRGIPDNVVLTAFKNLGLRVTSIAPTFYKKSLLSKAPYLLSIKGTKEALQTFVETYTGFNATISDTSKPPTADFNYSNLLLNAQDSNFHKGGLGSWKSVSNATLTVESSSDIPTTESGVLAGYSLKSQYRLKVVTADNTPTDILSQWRLGGSAQDQTPNIYEALGDGIPVEPGEEYTFYWAMKLGTGTTPAVKPVIKWYDTYGSLISTETPSSAINATSSWVRNEYTKIAPGKKTLSTGYSITTTGTIISSIGHGLSSGDTVYFEDEFLPFVGVRTVSSVTDDDNFIIDFSNDGITLEDVSSSVVGGVTILTIGDGNTSQLQSNNLITKSSGTGTLQSGTRLTGILSENTFTVNLQPSVALTGATILASIYGATVDFYVYKTNSAGDGPETPARYAMVGFTQTDRASTFYMSSFQFAKSGVAGFIEARCVDVYLEPSKINYLSNPSFAESTTGWTSPGGTLTNLENSTLVGVPYSSVGKMAKLVTSSSSSSSSIPDIRTTSAVTISTSNSYYTFSIYIKGDANYTLKLGLNNGGGRIKDTTINVTTSWQRFSVTMYVTNPSSGLYPIIYGTRSAAQTIRLKYAQLEETQKATDYFDGSFINQEAFWSGTSNASKSYVYVNKSQKMAEMSVHLNDWVPLGSVWMLRSYYGIEAIGLPSITTVSSLESYGSSSSSGVGGGSRLVTVSV